MVQAGSFYVAQNASLLREKLRQQRFPTQLQTAEVEGRTVYRVQVGPHATRAEGERTQVRLLREAGINGSLVPIYN
jgi:cell division septation protein DedD